MTTNENDKSIFIPRKRLLVLIGNTVLEQEKKRANYSGKNRYYFILSSRLFTRIFTT